MITNRKRIVALLAAGILAATTSAVYGAQLPQDTTLSLPSSSGSHDLSMGISEGSHELTSTRFVANYYAHPNGDSIQLRAMNSTVVLEREMGAGSSNYQKIGEYTHSEPYNIPVDQAISLEPGETLRVTVNASGPAFYGYNYVGGCSASRVFYYTLRGESLYMNITETSHTLTPTRFTASYEGSGSHQFRTMNSTVTIEREIGMNTSKFETVAVRQYGSAPYYISVDESVSLNPGERLRVTISSRASVFDGYEYVGDVFGYEEFIYTL